MKQALWIIGTLITIIGVLAALNLWSLGHKGYAFPDGDLPAHLAGRWDWASRPTRCDDSAHVIAFSPDRRVMTIAMRPRSTSDTGWLATYDLLSLTPTRIRGAIRAETRLTDQGTPVVWDLVMFGPDEYHWHRTDWAAWNYTPGVVRCLSPSSSAGDSGAQRGLPSDR